MKKIIPFKKDIIFKTNIAEVTSISLEHNLQMEKDSLITGEFMISVEYKISDTSTNTESFHFNLPFDIHMDDHYDLSDCKVDIYDFYYEIVNDRVLLVNIEVSVNNLKEKSVLEEVKRDVTDILEEKEVALTRENVDNSIDEKEEQDTKLDLKKEPEQVEQKEPKETMEESREESIPVMNQTVSASEKIASIFPDTFSSSETYATYKVYIVRENDTIEMVLQNYGITKEVLEQYNDLKEIKIGDKLIIPQLHHAQNS